MGYAVTGVDNLNDYYDVSLKKDRLAMIAKHSNASAFNFHQLDVTNTEAVQQFFKHNAPKCVVNLAGQAGVRYSIQNPMAYTQGNLVGFTNILEACRQFEVRHLVYASSSSVYGGNDKTPFNESDQVDRPVSFYAATKKANELMAHSYSHLYGLPTTGLRFFTVYGPWGRPVSPFLFADAIYHQRPIKVFNHGQMQRDFTYIDDIIEGLVRVLAKPATPIVDGHAPYRIFNVGNHEPIALLDFIHALEAAAGQSTLKTLMPMQDGDVRVTYADTTALKAWIGFAPATPLNEGLKRFVEWYKTYFDLGDGYGKQYAVG